MKLVYHKMLKYLLFMLVFGFTICTESVDVYSNSGSKTVYNKRVKRINHEPLAQEKEPVVIVEKTAPQNLNKVITDVKNKENELVGEINANVSTKIVITEAPVIIKKNDSDTHIYPVSPHSREHIGAAMRSFWVFLGLSIIVVIYFTFRAFKTRPGAAPPATVRKYGVVGRRGDLEMLPLPLNEEEDDDTLFDAAQQRR